VVALFLSNFVNKIDKKGRVSVPSTFRNILTSSEFQGVVVYASFINPAIEACSIGYLQELYNSIDLDPYSREHDAFVTTILGGSVQLSFDGEGRIVMPDQFIEFAKLGDAAAFVGKGRVFEIWNPERFAEYLESSRELATKSRLLTKSGKGSLGGGVV
jgi:MraZ protein